MGGDLLRGTVAGDRVGVRPGEGSGRNLRDVELPSHP